jgi:hypothetical protein
MKQMTILDIFIRNMGCAAAKRGKIKQTAHLGGVFSKNIKKNVFWG